MGNLIKVHGIVNLRRDIESGIFYTVMRHESKLITRSLSTKSKTTARLRHANVMAAHNLLVGARRHSCGDVLD